MALPFRRGDMVWSYFPYTENPDLPAAARHAAVIVGAFSATETIQLLGQRAPSYGLAVAVYTSSRLAKFAGNLPVGMIEVPLERAIRNSNNSAFSSIPGFGRIFRSTKAIFPILMRQTMASSRRLILACCGTCWRPTIG